MPEGALSAPQGLNQFAPANWQEKKKEGQKRKGERRPGFRGLLKKMEGFKGSNFFGCLKVGKKDN